MPRKLIPVLDQPCSSRDASPAAPLQPPSPHNANRLAWRIPSDLSARWRIRTLRVLVAGAIAIAVGMVLSSAASSWALLVVGAVVVAGTALLLARRWRRKAAQREQEDNVWLDDSGLHWRDGDAEGTLPREQVEGFRLGLDPDTVRAIPALTLILVGGFESQPVELHWPATTVEVREFLTRRWSLKETSVDPQRLSVLLYRTFETALSAADVPSEAEYLLLASLVEPHLQADGRWRVFRLPEGTVVFYDPGTAQLELSPPRGEDAYDLAGLVAVVDEQVLPTDEASRQKMLADAEEAAGRDFEQRAADDARAVGFHRHTDEANRRLVFDASRTNLFSLAERIDDAARFTPPPVGARPIQVRIGGLAHGVTIEVNRYEGIADDVLCATPEMLRDVAEQLCRRLATSRTGDEISLPLTLGGVRWTLVFVVQPPEFDPGAASEAA